MFAILLDNHMSVVQKCVVVRAKYEHVINVHLTNIIDEAVKYMNTDAFLEEVCGRK